MTSKDDTDSKNGADSPASEESGDDQVTPTVASIDGDAVVNQDAIDGALTKVRQLSAGFMSGPPWLALKDKITPEHISTILNGASKQNDLSHQDNKESRRYKMWYTLIAVAVFVFLTMYVMPKVQRTVF